MNVRLLRRIAKVIQIKPKEFDMHDYEAKVIKRGKPCGTTRCIAGWACELKKVKQSWFTPTFDTAAGLLDLDEDQARRLFMGDEWPRGYGKWRATPAQAVARIEVFIKSKGTI